MSVDLIVVDSASRIDLIVVGVVSSPAALMQVHLAAPDPHPQYTAADAAVLAAVAAGYQPLDSDLTAIAALSTTSYGRAFLAFADAAAGRVALGLGTAATQPSAAFDAAGAAAAAQAASQPLDSDLSAIAALATTTFGRALLTMADAAALRTAAGLGTLATQNGTFSGTSSGTNTGDQDLSSYAPLASPVFTAVPAAPTAPDLTNTTQLATTQYTNTRVAAAVAALIASSPSTLDTLKELADALADDPNFATTMSTALGNRLRVDTAAQGLSGAEQDNALTNLGLGANARSLVTAANYAAMRVLLGLVIGTDVQAHSATLDAVSGTNTGDQDLSGLVPKTTTVNGHALSANVSVTKSDVGLGSADNTSDAAKPVSTAQAAADAAVLAAAEAYADTLVVGLVDDRGNFDASGNAFPSSGGSGAAGAIKKGDLWTVSVAGTLGGHAVTAGDLVRALSDTPGQTDGNWALTENNIGYVAENAANKDASGGYAGLTLFKLNLRNAANTITSWFTTAATVARTWTMPDKDGTVAMTSDITGTNSGTNTGDETVTRLGALINGATAKVTPVSADAILLMDSEAANVGKKVLWSDVVAADAAAATAAANVVLETQRSLFNRIYLGGY